MPQRSNQFQDLVTMIERALAPRGAKVTESAMVLGADDEEEPREIDVLIESNLGPYTMKVAVEAKDEKRKMDVVRFESIVAKYKSKSGIQVNKVVVVSRSGFSKRVVKRAQIEDIELLTLSEALAEDWAGNTPQRLDFRVPPHFAGIEIHPRPSKEDAGGICSEGHIICLCCGKDHGTPNAFIHTLMTNQDLVLGLREEASRRDGSVCTKAERKLRLNVVVRYRGTDHCVECLTYHVHCTHARTELSVKAYRRGEHLIHHMSGAAAGKDFQIVVPNGHESEQIVFKISDAPSSGARTVTNSQHRITELPRTAAAQALADLITHQCEGFPITIEAPSTVHDFSTGEDVPIDLLVRIYVIGHACRLRIAVLFLAAEEINDGEKIKRWARIAGAAELDRLLLIASKGHIQRATFPKPLGAIEKEAINADNLFDYLWPELVLFSAAVRSAECVLFSSNPDKPSQIDDHCYLIHGDTKMSAMNLVNLVLQRAMTAVLQSFAADDSTSSFFADRELRFEFNLPEATFLTALDETSSSVGKVVGSVTVRVMFAVMGSPALEHSVDGVQTLRFPPKDPTFPSLIAATQKSPKAFRVLGSLPTAVQSLPPKSLPERVFAKILGPSSAADAAGHIPFKIAAIRWKADDQIRWTTAVLTPSTLAQSIHEWPMGTKKA